MYKSAESRAKKKNLPFNIRIADIAIPTHCPVLGIPLDSRDRDHTPSLDEVVYGLGYIKRNVAVISGRANRFKSDATADELKAVARYAELRSHYAIHGVPDLW